MGREVGRSGRSMDEKKSTLSNKKEQKGVRLVFEIKGEKEKNLSRL